MKKAIFDTSLLLTAVKEKIDVFDEMTRLGISVVIPEQVLNELKSIAESSPEKNLRENSSLALKILNKSHFEKIKIPGKIVDNAIINFAKENPDFIVATLDRDIKKKVKNSKLVIRQKKKLGVV